MKRYAFIDVQNTETTALKTLGFEIDWKKLFQFLKDDWNCLEATFYPGIDYTDQYRQEVFNELQEIGARVVPKYYKVYKVGDKVIKHNCTECGTEQAVIVDMGYQWKCNCDVELTLDVMQLDFNDSEVLLFTGDGDFEYLAQYIIEKGGKVAIVSSSKKMTKSKRYFTARLSTKFNRLREDNSNSFRILELNNIKLKIKK